jgi:hypothetical protein
MSEETLTGTSSTKVFNDAPIFLKESLTFPYSYGMNFVLELLQNGGKEKAYAAVLQNPPHTTRQIMEPKTYLAGERIPPLPVPDFKRDFKDYQKFDIGAMGEFDVALLVEQYEGKELAKKIYPDWRGGYYYAAKAKTDGAAPLGLLYVSRWSSPESASRFAGIYAHSLKERYKTVNEVGAPAVDPKPADSQSGDLQRKETQAKDHESPPTPPALSGRHTWSTEEGTVVIEEKGDTVFVSESLDPATTTTLEKEVFPATSSAK